MAIFPSSTSATFTAHQRFNPGDTVYFESWLTRLEANASVAVELTVRTSVLVLVSTIATGTVSLVADTVTKLSDFGIARSWTIPSDQAAGLYVVRLELESDEYVYGYFDVVAASPTITSPAIAPASIDQSESATVTCTSETGNSVTLYISTKAIVMTEGETGIFSTTLYGLNYTAAVYALKIVAENASELIVVDETLTLTVTDSDVEAVQHIYNILDANWNAGNVTKPTLVIGGTAGHDDTRGGDLIKMYRSPRPAARVPRARYSYETRTEYVQLSIHTSNTTPRAQLEALQTEITRILNSAARSPGGGYTRLWAEYPDVRKESSKHFWAVVDVAMDKIYKVAAT